MSTKGNNQSPGYQEKFIQAQNKDVKLEISDKINSFEIFHLNNDNENGEGDHRNNGDDDNDQNIEFASYIEEDDGNDIGQEIKPEFIIDSDYTQNNDQNDEYDDIVYLEDQNDDDDDLIIEDTINSQKSSDSNPKNEDLYHCDECNVVFKSIDEHFKNFHKNIKNNDRNLVISDIVDEAKNTDQDDTEYFIIEEVEDKTNHENNDNISEIKSNDKNRKNNKKFNESINHLCLQCNRVFDTIIEAELHSCTNTNNYNENMLMESSKKNERVEEEYICNDCNIMFRSSRSLALHRRIHNKEKSMIKRESKNDKLKLDSQSNLEITNDYHCELCNTKFLTSKSLKLHAKMHNPSTIKNSFDRIIKTEKKIIEKSGHFSNELFWCDICEKYYDKVFQDVHKKAHGTESKIFCLICNKKFGSDTECQIHMKLHENQPKRRGVTKAEIAGITLPYECTYCGRQFKKPHEKVKHERIHTGEKPHKCDICGKCFRVAYCLTLHVRTHTNARPYVCSTCNKRFKSVSVYTHHLASHSDERAYKCLQCPKTFKTAVSLAGHRKSHTKPFTCVECNRPFASLYAVKTHMETHKKMKTNLKHDCIVCGAVYAKIFALRDHMKEKHSDVQIISDSDIITDVIITGDNDDDGIMMTTTDVPSSMIIEQQSELLNDTDKIDEMAVIDVGDFHTEEIITDFWIKQ